MHLIQTSYLNNNSFYLQWNSDECKLGKSASDILLVHLLPSLPCTTFVLQPNSDMVGQWEIKTLPSLIIPSRSGAWALSFAAVHFQLWVMNHEVNPRKYQWSNYIWQADRDWIKILFLMSENLFWVPCSWLESHPSSNLHLFIL